MQGSPSEPGQLLQRLECHQRICALRAPTVFCVRIKTIRTQNTVMDKSKDSAGVLYKIADCVRTAFRPCAIGDPRGRFSSAQNRNSATTGARFKSPRITREGRSMPKSVGVIG